MAEADPRPSRSSSLLSGTGIEESQPVDPDPLLPRARARFRKSSSGARAAPATRGAGRAASAIPVSPISPPAPAHAAKEMRQASEPHAPIGPPEEIVRRPKRLETGGFEHLLLIDGGGLLSVLRTSAREVMPEFAN